MKHKINISLAVVLLALTASCSTESMSEYERTMASFLDMINGDISSAQTWKTAVLLRVHANAEGPVKLWLMSGKDKGTLYDYKQVESNSTVDLCAPQGQGETMYIVSICNHSKLIHEVVLDGNGIQEVDLDCSDDAVAVSDADVGGTATSFGSTSRPDATSPR